jgi:hypothetical protein
MLPNNHTSSHNPLLPNRLLSLIRFNLGSVRQWGNTIVSFPIAFFSATQSRCQHASHPGNCEVRQSNANVSFPIAFSVSLNQGVNMRASLATVRYVLFWSVPPGTHQWPTRMNPWLRKLLLMYNLRCIQLTNIFSVHPSLVSTSIEFSPLKLNVLPCHNSWSH